MRFGVRNARFSEHGKINSYITCKLTLEFIGRFWRLNSSVLILT